MYVSKWDLLLIIYDKYNSPKRGRIDRLDCGAGAPTRASISI